ncbi:hypothetical protein [Brasilonema sp. UFV-L1]|uniref:hypothetical protein n=1 Tax=Brasilonema sp. UFV-L1 TaxID=2234130 RepID=UPI00145E5197|nr:hypothetical protein [Brasilonema sp. UFV-L1]NMG07720.1 hypothetical protein [Brasilonema sp. UFV-L1]
MSDSSRRGKRGPAPSWKLGRTSVIRVPIILADTLLNLARRIDNDEVTVVNTYLTESDKQVSQVHTSHNNIEEFLHQLMENQNQYLHHNKQELQEIEQELTATTHQLHTIFSKECLPRLTLSEAKEQASIILKDEKSLTESLAELLGAIYSVPVKLEELKEIEELSMRRNDLATTVDHEIIAKSKKLRTHSKQLHAQYNELGCRLVALKASLIKFREQWTQFRKIQEQNKHNGM